MKTIALVLNLSPEVAAVLEYYALFCLILLPATLLYMVLTYHKKIEKGKKPLCSKATKWIAEKMEKESQQAPGQPTPEQPKPAETVQNVEVKAVEEKQVENIVEAKVEDNKPEPAPEQKKDEKVSSLRLLVGDKYCCHLNNIDAVDLLGESKIWTSDNSFVAEIESQSGSLSALRVGHANISYGETNTRIYSIDILPTNCNWRYKDLLFPLFGIEDLGDCLERFEEWNKKSVEEGVILTTETERIYIHIEWGKVTALAFKGKNIKREDFAKMTSEYMKHFVPDDNKYDTEYWYHLSDAKTDGRAASVDAIAMMYCNKGVLWFCISKCWRDNATENEVTSNPGLLHRTLAELIKDGVTIAVKKEEKKSDKTKKGEDKKEEKEQKGESAETQAGQNQVEGDAENSDQGDEDIPEGGEDEASDGGGLEMNYEDGGNDFTGEDDNEEGEERGGSERSINADDENDENNQSE